MRIISMDLQEEKVDLDGEDLVVLICSEAPATLEFAGEIFHRILEVVVRNDRTWSTSPYALKGLLRGATQAGHRIIGVADELGRCPATFLALYINAR